MVSTNWVSTGPGLEEEPEESPEPGNEEHQLAHVSGISDVHRNLENMVDICAGFVLICFYIMHLWAPALSLLFPCAIFKARFEQTVTISCNGIWIWLGISPSFHHKELANCSNSLCTPHATRWQLLSINYSGNICIPIFFLQKTLICQIVATTKDSRRSAKTLSAPGLLLHSGRRFGGGTSTASAFSASFCAFLILDFMWATNGLRCRSLKKAQEFERMRVMIQIMTRLDSSSWFGEKSELLTSWFSSLWRRSRGQVHSSSAPWDKAHGQSRKWDRIKHTHTYINIYT